MTIAQAAQRFIQQDNAQSTFPKPKGHVIIAVDGPAASGKGTLAKKIAERLNYAYLDTGALYRAVGLAVLETCGNPNDINDVMPALNIVKKYLTPELLSNPELRRADVAAAASQVAALPRVREELFEFQKNFAYNPPGYVGGAVLDGRDIGTVICPNADIKFYVTASCEERARRRFNENTVDTTYEAVLADIRARDERDQSRTTAPTKQAEDAHFIDTTELNAQLTLDHAVGIIRDAFIAQVEDKNQ